MSISELKSMTAEALNEELLAVRREQFNLRMQQSTGQMTKSHLMRAARKKIAQIKTLMHSKAGENND